jgi:hypothetical protein
MPDKPAPASPQPAIVRHYAAYLQAKAHIAPETHVNGASAELRITTGEKTLVLVFSYRKKKWSLRTIEIRHGEQTTSFTPGQLAKAIAALLGHQPPAGTQQAVNAASGPRTDAALRERRTTVIRT